MPNRLKITIIAAMFFGFIAAYGIYNFMRQQRESTEALRKANQPIVVAAKNIPAGTRLTQKRIKEGLLKINPWPKSSVPAGSFTSTRQVVGKVIRVKVVAGEPILKSKMGKGEEKLGLTVRLEPGHRAMAVRVDEIVGVSGFIAPEDRVDVIVTMVPPGRTSTNDKFSKIVLQNKRVLSVAQSIEQQKDGKPKVVRSITLEVTPQEAEKLSLASQEGQIILALRAAGDEKVAKTRGSNKSDLLARVARRRRARVRTTPGTAPVPQKYRVEVYMGSERSVVEF
ncbi:MAG: Flp pilus assembly protein CpaB [Candidatus Binatia bacterium]